MVNFNKWYLVPFIVLVSFTANAQKVALKVGTNPTTINPSAVLEIESTTKGFLFPRMTSLQRNTIFTPAAGLMVYDTDLKDYSYYNGTQWVIAGTSNNWSLTGNAGTNPATNFLGTTDAQDLVLKTNNAEKMRVTSIGNVGIGITAPISELHVSSVGGVLGLHTAVTVDTYGGDGGYFVGRSARGTSTSPLPSLYNDGLATLQGAGYDTNGFTGRQAAISIYADESWTPTAHGSLIRFATTPVGSTIMTEKMKITGDGKVGIGQANPSAQLHVTDGFSNLRFGNNLSSGNGGPSLMLESENNVFADILWRTAAANQVRLRGSSYGLAIGGSVPRLNIGYPDANYTSSALVVNGNVGIGTTTPSRKLEVVGGLLVTTNINANYVETATDLRAWRDVLAARDLQASRNVNAGNSVNANVGMNSPIYNVTSDVRLKRNIKKIDNALQTVVALRPVSYEKKKTIEATEYDIKETGFIAQELQKILPDLVGEGPNKDKTLVVNYTAIIPILTKAIQEQQVQIEQQQIQINELKALLKK